MGAPDRPVKQVIVVRRDLGMSVGKTCSQVAHGSMAFLSSAVRCGTNLTEMHESVRLWINGKFTKIVVGVDDEESLRRVHWNAIQAGITCHLIEDDGTTAFRGVKTATVVAVGPWWSPDIDAITGGLKLL